MACLGRRLLTLDLGALVLCVKVEGYTRIHHGFVRRLMVGYLQVETVTVKELQDVFFFFLRISTEVLYMFGILEFVHVQR